METYSSDFEKVAKLNDELQPMIQEKETLEERWMEISDSLE
jgi:hypothetical protein